MCKLQDKYTYFTIFNLYKLTNCLQHSAEMTTFAVVKFQNNSLNYILKEIKSWH